MKTFDLHCLSSRTWFCVGICACVCGFSPLHYYKIVYSHYVWPKNCWFCRSISSESVPCVSQFREMPQNLTHIGMCEQRPKKPQFSSRLTYQNFTITNYRLTLQWEKIQHTRTHSYLIFGFWTITTFDPMLSIFDLLCVITLVSGTNCVCEREKPHTKWWKAGEISTMRPYQCQSMWVFFTYNSFFLTQLYSRLSFSVSPTIGPSHLVHVKWMMYSYFLPTNFQ